MHNSNELQRLTSVCTCICKVSDVRKEKKRETSRCTQTMLTSTETKTIEIYV